MIYFNNDYSEGCHPRILEQLLATNLRQTPGYGTDCFCKAAADRIRTLCGNKALQVHFLVGGTQANLTVIAAALRPYQAVLSAVTGHINVHETGAIEATGHKVIGLASADGKVTAAQIEKEAVSQGESMDAEHMVQPKLVYISNPTELGTIYSLEELEAISTVCRKYGLYLFLDGARLGYGLTARGNDLTFMDIARLCDAFYIGGTKVGALFGEAVVIRNAEIAENFRYMIKQRGGMLAKGRLLGMQFEVLLKNDLYLNIAAKANAQAERIRETLDQLGCSYLVQNTTNQIFPILSDNLLNELSKEFCFSEMERIDETHRAVRFCTSWATTEENVEALCRKLLALKN